MKLCKDCKHIRKDVWFFGLLGDKQFSKCKATAMIDVVTGKRNEYFCSTERFVNIGDCGPEGRLWEAKE